MIVDRDGDPFGVFLAIFIAFNVGMIVVLLFVVVRDVVKLTGVIL